MIVGGTLWIESEFQYVAATSRNVTGACGVNAAAMAESWASGRYVSTSDVYGRMWRAGRLDGANGETNIPRIAAQLRDDAYGEWQQGYLPGLAPLPLATIDAHLDACRVVVIEVSNGQALRDLLSGAGENARGLQYHIFVLVGRHSGGYSRRAGRDLPAGYWALDGDNFATPRAVSTSIVQFYPVDVLSAARPIGAVGVASKIGATLDADTALASQPSSSSGNGGSGSMLQIGAVSAWFEQISDSCWRRKDHPEITLQHGMLAWYRGLSETGLPFVGLPTSNEYGTGQPNSALQDFERATGCYDPDRHCDNPPNVSGAVYLAHLEGLRADRDALRAQVADLTQKLALAQATQQAASDAAAHALLHSIKQMVASY